MDPAALSDSEIGSSLSLELHLRRDLGDDRNRQVEEWFATAHVLEWDDDDDEAKEHPIGHAHIVRCRVGSPNTAEILDSIEGDLINLAADVLDLRSGDPAAELEESLQGWGETFLILNRVEINPEWRGRRIGRWVAAEALESLQGGSSFVALTAAPLTDSVGADRRRASNKLKRVWAELGFEHLKDDTMVLDLSLVHLGNALEALRKQFGVR